MTSKERMLAAINRKKPDRLPVTIHQWQPYHLKNYMDGMTDIQANRACGFDASINFYEEIRTKSDNWRVSSTIEQKIGYYVTHYTIETPEGTLTRSEGTSPMTTWVMGHIIKNEDDIYLIKRYRPMPKLDKEKAIKIYDELGDDGIFRTFVFGKQGGCWQDACELYGLENLIMQTYDNPDWVKELMDILLEQKLSYIEENLKGMPFDIIETGGGASSNTVISPDIHREYCLPYDTKMHDLIRNIGHKSVYHTCGGMTKIVDLIIQNHCDVSETLSPTGVGGDIANDEDAKKIYSVLHPHVGIIGGMDQNNILEKGTPEMIKAEVKRLFNIYGKDGGYIMSACDHFFDAPKQQLIEFANAAKEFVY